jgi:pyruvate dehydrogenase (quinone)
MMSELTDVLRYAGVERVYGVGEDSLKSIAQAISTTDGMAWIEVLDEQAAAFAAADEAKSTGRLAVCAGSYGGGTTHLVSGLYDAHRSGAPVFAVASHISTERLGGALVKEIHPERLFADCSHYTGVVSHPWQLSWLARTAMRNAIVRGGVAVLLLDPPSGRAHREHGGHSASCGICGHAIRGRQPQVRVHGYPLHAACAVRRRRALMR